MKRRTFVGGCMATSLLPTHHLLAATTDSISNLRASNSLNEIMSSLGAEQAQPSQSIHIKVPSLAEDGASVAVSVSVEMEGVKRIVLLAEKNPRPLVADVSFMPGGVPFLSTRMRLSDDSQVLALAWSNDGLFLATEQVEVAVGGCGKG